MTEPPSRVAVLLPCYQPGDELDATLRSLENQGVAFKLFVVDDGSAHKPDYATLLKPFSHRFMGLPENVGVMRVRNPALEAILAENFEYVALIDCGDFAKPGRLRKQLDYLEEHPDCDILGSWVELAYETGPHKVSQFPASHQAARHMLSQNMPVCHPALMIRTSVFKAIGLYRDIYPAAEDFDMIQRAVAAGFRIANLQEVLLQKNETRNSVSWKRRREQLLSRFQIQWANRNLFNPASVKGLLRTATVLALPAGTLRSLKSLISKQI